MRCLVTASTYSATTIGILWVRTHTLHGRSFRLCSGFSTNPSSAFQDFLKYFKQYLTPTKLRLFSATITTIPIYYGQGFEPCMTDIKNEVFPLTVLLPKRLHLSATITKPIKFLSAAILFNLYLKGFGTLQPWINSLCAVVTPPLWDRICTYHNFHYPECTLQPKLKVFTYSTTTTIR